MVCVAHKITLSANRPGPPPHPRKEAILDWQTCLEPARHEQEQRPACHSAAEKDLVAGRLSRIERCHAKPLLGKPDHKGSGHQPNHVADTMAPDSKGIYQPYGLKLVEARPDPYNIRQLEYRLTDAGWNLVRNFRLIMEDEAGSR